MRLISIVSVGNTEILQDDFRRLLISGKKVVDLWIIVHRGGSAREHQTADDFIGRTLGNHNYLLQHCEPCGGARSRNYGIDVYNDSPNKTYQDVVSFPDDDCVYPPYFRTGLIDALNNSDADVLVIPYGPSYEGIARDRWPEYRKSLNASSISTYAATAGIFIKMSSRTRLPRFDEKLGVGTPMNSAEDTEYVLRMQSVGNAIDYDGTLYIKHPYKPPVPKRIIGNAACMWAYRQFLPPSQVAKSLMRFSGYILRLLADKNFKMALSAIKAVSGYKSITDKTPVGGLHFNRQSPAVLADIISERALQTDKPLSVFAGHISSLNARHDDHFRRAFNRADFAMADGISLVLVSLLTPGVGLRKMATTDFAPLLISRLRDAQERSVRAAIVGGEGETARFAGQKLERQFDVISVYSSHGYRQDADEVVREINAAKPDVVIIGMGMPTEALWVDAHVSKINAKLIITCGGWLRLLSGEEKRSPAAMQVLQMEWLWRLITDFTRTGARYAMGVKSVSSSIADGWLK